MKKILLTTTALHQPWNEGDWDMTDGNTHAIAQHLDEREDWDALQEVTAELEQAEARIEELEETLSLRTKLHGEATYVISDLEAKLAKAVRALEFYADPTYSGYDVCITDYGLSVDRGCIIQDDGDRARTTLAELSSVSCSNSKGQDGE